MLSWIKYARASFLPNLIFLKPYLPRILQETMVTTRKQLWLNVQIAIFFGAVSWKPLHTVNRYRDIHKPILGPFIREKISRDLIKTRLI